jgi:hypothetical protein
MIDKKEKIFDEKIEKVNYVYTSWQKCFETLSSTHNDVVFTNSIPDIPHNNTERIVFDDFQLQHEGKDNKRFTDICIRLSHYLNLTVICTWQTLFLKGLKTVSPTYLILFPFKRDQSCVDVLNRQIRFQRSVMQD